MAATALVALGIRGHPFHDPFHGQQTTARSPLHYYADSKELLPGVNADRPSLGYEPYDRVCLRRPRLSLAGVVTSADRTDRISLFRLRLPRLGLSCRVRFTNRFTKQAIYLQLPTPFPVLPLAAVLAPRARYVQARQGTV